MSTPLSDPVAKRPYTIGDRMAQAVRDQIEREIQAAREEIIKRAVEEFLARIRQAVGLASCQASNFYTVHNVGNELVIRVKIEDGDRDTNSSLAR